MTEFHPSSIPLAKIFDVVDVAGASEAAAEMIRLGFGSKGFKVLMPKEKRLAKRIGYTLVTSVNNGLRSSGQARNVQYWTYHEDETRYALVLAGSACLEKLGS